ncbi:cytochrome P450 monooxygenase-like protein [Decorospora gaudefroyi]|uniref:Cytochrome P450 monooxygenase-like protein n=1 Tax=Decorospora gaudefroyi TaxID=184978 RepID=A0A6A5K7A5_9PLEO|nr:cytochrome P450 monooxygenase-like protein [Decorospora gaudefroyi]
MPLLSALPEELRLFSFTGIVLSFGLFFVLASLYVVYTCIYNVFLHPLKHIPGPLLAGASGIPYVLHMRNGSIVPWMKKLHEEYGDAVRVAPDEVSFISGETAWPDIYGFRTGKYKNTGPYLKDKSWYLKPLNGVRSIVSADEETHSRMRKNLSHAFSDKALRQQEPLIQGYVDLLVHRLREHATEGKDVDIMRWYNYATFDIIADLTFGEPLYCLRDSAYHSWVTLAYGSIKAIGLIATRNKYPLFNYYDKCRNIFQDTTAHQRARKAFFQISTEKVSQRLEKIGAQGQDEAGRPDFFTHIIQNQESESKRLTRGEMDVNAQTFLLAGSETTATILSGATYLLLTNPSVYTKLVHEIRSTFTDPADITVERVNKLEYMIACFQEAFRIYPPVATGFPRVVPAGGDTISGHYVPGGTAVYVSQHATNHATRNYKDPEVFIPERWLGDERFKNDKRETLNPFSFGPRNCLGKNLAYAEMRLILAKVLFAFDIELVDKSRDWIGLQKVFTLWEKDALMVKVKTVQR